jgi:dienelactone hydrolase
MRCDNCDNQIELDENFAGKSIRCPRCRQVVPVRGRRNREVDDCDRRELRHGRSREQSSGSVALWIGLAVGGAALMLAAVAVVVVLSFVGPRAPAGPNIVAGLPNDPEGAPAALPEFSPARPIQSGVMFQEAVIRPGALPMKVWYYFPEQSKGKLPLVLVPPAGSTLLAGMALGDGDRAEHYPYVRAGFAVGSFENDGNVPHGPGGASDAAELKGAREFRDARAGLNNAKAALDFLLAKAPDVDPNRIFIAGHSSAATLALLVAEHEPRIKGCVSYCAVCDVETRLAPFLSPFDRDMPGYRDFIRFSSPTTHVKKLTCPVLLFHARDDTTAPVSETTNFAELLRKTNPNVTVDTSARGGHYQSMIRVGIPKGIAWMRQQQPEPVTRRIEFVVFSAIWCEVCREIPPVFEKLRASFPSVTFSNLDINDKENEKRWVDYGSDTVPYYYILADGKVVAKFRGFLPYDNAEKFVRQTLNKLGAPNKQ